MENASKALIMAGAILLAILVISLGVVTFFKMSESVVDNTTLDKEKIESFNERFMPYLGKKISGSQVNALIQLATSINYEAISNGDNVRQVTIVDSSNSPLVKVDSGKVISTKVPTGVYYEVEAAYSDKGLINTITVTSK